MTEPTREALHRLAEHILSPALYAASDEIGLSPAEHGIKTPAYGDDQRVLEIAGAELLLHTRTATRRTPISTLRAAGEFAGIEPGAPAGVYAPATPCDLDASLAIDPATMQTLADWYNLGAQALRDLSAGIAEDEPSAVTLWPEHLDVAISAARINYGFSPGDDYHNAPYAYVGPFDPPASDGFWNAPFGALRTPADLPTAAAALAFLTAGRRRAMSLA